MQIKFNIPFKAMPLNMIYSQSKSGRRFKSAKYTAWSSDIMAFLNENYNDEYEMFQKHYNVFESYITLDFVFYKKVFTKDQRISKHSGDVSNLCKPIEDQIANYLEFDDNQVISISATKIESDHDRIDLVLNVRQLAAIK